MVVPDPLAGGSLTILTSSLPPGISGLAFRQSFSATGGTPPYTWSEAGVLPSGLNLTPAGVLSGTPSSTGTVTPIWTVTDSASATESVNLPLTISAPVSISTTSLPSGTVSVAYSQMVSASGGNVPYNCSVAAGSLPAGLSLSAASNRCLISGTPTGSGTVSFSVTVADSTVAANGGPSSPTQPLSITVVSPISISPTGLANGLLNAVYPATTFTASGGTAPYTWTILSGSLPAGMALSSGGVLSGTPGTAGAYSFTIEVTDSRGLVQQASYTLTIASGVSSCINCILRGTVLH